VREEAGKPLYLFDGGLSCPHTHTHTFSLSRSNGAEPDRETWEAAHQAFVQAFVSPPDVASQKKLAKLLKRPLPKEVADALFTYDGFLHGLGRMSLSCVMKSKSFYYFYFILLIIYDRSRGSWGIVHVAFAPEP
jgi:hypothetical protein